VSRKLQLFAGILIAILGIARIATATSGGECNTRITYRSDTVPPYVHPPQVTCERNACPSPCGVAVVSWSGYSNYSVCYCQHPSFLWEECNLAYKYTESQGGGQLQTTCMRATTCPPGQVCIVTDEGSEPLELGPGWNWIYGCICVGDD